MQVARERDVGRHGLRLRGRAEHRGDGPVRTAGRECGDVDERRARLRHLQPVVPRPHHRMAGIDHRRSRTETAAALRLDHDLVVAPFRPIGHAAGELREARGEPGRRRAGLACGLDVEPSAGRARELHPIQIDHLPGFRHEPAEIDRPLYSQRGGVARCREFDGARRDPGFLQPQPLVRSGRHPAAQPGRKGIVPAQLSLPLHRRQVAGRRPH
ncbi:MAG: hypothetical protein EBS56_06675, partial [Planctomycetia bacterium]|nr:hypothetical protein [Planctomycetia bacterium]